MCIRDSLATALYYGLYTDTGEFTEITHSLDRDLRDEADFDNTIAVSYTHLDVYKRQVIGSNPIPATRCVSIVPS